MIPTDNELLAAYISQLEARIKYLEEITKHLRPQ